MLANMYFLMAAYYLLVILHGRDIQAQKWKSTAHLRQMFFIFHTLMLPSNAMPTLSVFLILGHPTCMFDLTSLWTAVKKLFLHHLHMLLFNTRLTLVQIGIFWTKVVVQVQPIVEFIGT